MTKYLHKSVLENFTTSVASVLTPVDAKHWGQARAHARGPRLVFPQSQQISATFTPGRRKNCARIGAKFREAKSRFHNIQPMDPILSQMNPIHTPTFSFFNNHAKVFQGVSFLQFSRLKFRKNLGYLPSLLVTFPANPTLHSIILINIILW